MQCSGLPAGIDREGDYAEGGNPLYGPSSSTYISGRVWDGVAGSCSIYSRLKVNKEMRLELMGRVMLENPSSNRE